MLILLTSELGFRIGEILGIDYTKDIDYENHEIRVDFRMIMKTMQEQKMPKNEEDGWAMIPLNSCFIISGEYWDILQKQEYLFINIKEIP